MQLHELSLIAAYYDSTIRFISSYRYFSYALSGYMLVDRTGIISFASWLGGKSQDAFINYYGAKLCQFHQKSFCKQSIQVLCVFTEIP